MVEALTQSAVFAWPLALTFASVAIAERVRSRRRRERLNQALHELRRPLHALELARSQETARRRGGQLELALDALADLDRAINGDPAVPCSSIVDVRPLAEEAVARWRPVAARRGRRLELRWHANGSRIRCDPSAVARAVDNLIANALEHGGGPIRVECVARCGRLRLLVSDGVAGSEAPALPSPRSLHRLGVWPRRDRSDPRRGHGLRLVAEVAAKHGGRFASCRHRAGASAVIELPLADA